MTWQALGLPPCHGVQIEGAPVALPYSGVRIRPLACIEEGSIVGRYVDVESGLSVEPDDQRTTDNELFTILHDRIDERLREEIDEVDDPGYGGDGTVLADVWYHAQTPHVLDRDALLHSKALQEQVAMQTRLAYTEVSVPLTDAMRRAGAIVLSDSNLAFPVVSVRATPVVLREIGGMAGVVRVMPHADSEEEIKAAEAYYDVDFAGPVHSSIAGAGIKIANFEGDIPDSSQNVPFASGSACTPSSGPSYDCACSSTNMHAHARRTAGVLANTVSSLRGGLAPDAVIYTANDGGCGLSNALDWAVSKGTTVISRSASHSPLSAQSALNMKMDYVVTKSPWPFIAAATHNGGNHLKPGNLLKNGMVVGGSNDNGSTNRANLTLYSGSQGTNPESGWEFPHIVAPAVSIDTAGFNPNAVNTVTGTSYSTPQVAGTAASIQSGNSDIKSWPMALMASILVGPERDVHGVWPLSFHDGVDDQDGTGSLHSYFSAIAGVNRRTEGQAHSFYGYDRRISTPSSNPAWTWLAQDYNARAGAGSWLRAAVVMSSAPACNSSGENCTGNPHPMFYLGIYDTSNNELAYSWHGSNNWQYVAIKNTSGSARNYKLKVFVSSWAGVALSEVGVAWVSSAGQ